MSNPDVTAVVERAIRAARDLSWFSEYTQWATRWLVGCDRTCSAASLARARVKQWVDFGGRDFPAGRCLGLAAEAAEELARSATQTWRLTSAKESAEAAIRWAARANEPTPGPGRPDGPELVIDDWNYSPGGARRGRSYDPREV